MRWPTRFASTGNGGRCATMPSERGVRLLGDVAIYVGEGSVDHRSHPGLFREGAVAGAPPDAFSDLGSVVGQPAVRLAGVATGRLPLVGGTGAPRTDACTTRCGSITSAASSRTGRCRRAPRTPAAGGGCPGPDGGLFEAIERELSGAGRISQPTALEFDPHASRPSATTRLTLPFVAEDLGVITPAVQHLRDSLGLPGMLVLQFGFDPRVPRSPHRFANHVENRFVYTGTHDHDTARGWYESIPARIRARVDAELREAGVWEPEPWWGLVRLALASPARVAMVQAQDVLGLGSEARMNDPARRGETGAGGCARER